MGDTPLAGRVAVVSGGGRGLGRSFCLALARQGAKVVVNNRLSAREVLAILADAEPRVVIVDPPLPPWSPMSAPSASTATA